MNCAVTLPSLSRDLVPSALWNTLLLVWCASSALDGSSELTTYFLKGMQWSCPENTKQVTEPGEGLQLPCSSAGPGSSVTCSPAGYFILDVHIPLGASHQRWLRDGFALNAGICLQTQVC